jgi:phosphoglycerate dehydrogenase-like enzyme
VGPGPIGRQVARRAAAFDMTVVYAGRRRLPPDPEAGLGGARHVPLDELLRTADYVSLDTPLTEETRQLLDAGRQEKGLPAGAGIDVFDPEPLTPALRPLRAPNVVLSPYVRGVTRDTLVRIAPAAVRNVAASCPDGSRGTS